MPISLPYVESDYVGFEVYGRLFGQETRTKFVYKVAESTGIVEADAAAEAFAANHLSTLTDQLSNDFEIYNLRVRVWGNLGVLAGWYDKTVNLGGEVNVESLPPSVAWVIRKFTGLPGRTNRGRWYIPGVPQDAHTEGTIDVALRPVFEDAAEDLGTNLLVVDGTGILTPQLVTYFPSGSLNTMKDITAALPTWILRSQRRREVGVGI